MTTIQPTAFLQDIESQLERQKELSSLPERMSDYANKSSGAGRLLSMLILLVSCVERALGASPSTQILKSTFAGGSSGLNVVRLGPKTLKAHQTIQKISEEDETPLERKVASAVQDSMKAIIAWCKALLLFSTRLILLQVSRLSSLTESATDFWSSVKDYCSAAKYELLAQGAVKDALTHARKYHMLQVAASMLSITTGVFSALSLFFGIKLVSSTALIALSLVTILLVIRGEFYKDEGTYKLIDLAKA